MSWLRSVYCIYVRDCRTTSITSHIINSMDSGVCMAHALLYIISNWNGINVRRNSASTGHAAHGIYSKEIWPDSGIPFQSSSFPALCTRQRPFQFHFPTKNPFIDWKYNFPLGIYYLETYRRTHIYKPIDIFHFSLSFFVSVCVDKIHSQLRSIRSYDSNVIYCIQLQFIAFENCIRDLLSCIRTWFMVY